MSGKALKDKLVRGDRVYGTFFQHTVVPALVDAALVTRRTGPPPDGSPTSGG